MIMGTTGNCGSQTSTLIIRGMSNDEIELKDYFKAVWKELPYGSENTVVVHIRHLREKIEINPAEPRYLKVVWGHGYKMESK